MKLSEFLPKCGIYSLTNTITGKIYIGKSNYIQFRICSHVRDLLNLKHSNVSLTDDLLKYGLDNFKLQILLLCDEDNLALEEGKMILKLNLEGYSLYNILTGVGSNHFKGKSRVKNIDGTPRKDKRKFKLLNAKLANASRRY